MNDFNRPGDASGDTSTHSGVVPVNDFIRIPKGAPSAPAISKRDKDGVWQLTCLCPFCKKRHFHGGGSGPAPDLGLRSPHCSPLPQTASDYNLVPAPDGHELYSAAKRDREREKRRSARKWEGRR